MTAAHVMIVSVYGVLDAFAIVRLNAGSVELTMTFGKSASHRVSTAKTTVPAPNANAQPSRHTDSSATGCEGGAPSQYGTASIGDPPLTSRPPLKSNTVSPFPKTLG